MSKHQYPQTHFERIQDVNIQDEQHLPALLLDQLETPYHKVYDGWREITESQFVKSGFFTFHIQAMQYKSIAIEPQHGQWATRAFLFSDGTGVALVQDYWGGKLRYFAFGCDHDWQIENIGRCLHKHTCRLCNCTMEIDSSD